MSLTKQEVEHLAELARLKLSEEEKEKFSNQLSSILDYVAKLQQVSTQGVEETARITGLKNVGREDKVKKCESQETKKLVEAAPEHEQGLIKTKAVFGE